MDSNEAVKILTEAYKDKLDEPLAKLIPYKPDEKLIRKITNQTELPFPKVDFFVFIDETDLSEWIVFGYGFNGSPEDDFLDVDAMKRRVYKQTGLLPTDQLFTIEHGDPVKFDRVIPIKDLTMREYLQYRYTSNVLMRVYE